MNMSTKISQKDAGRIVARKLRRRTVLRIFRVPARVVKIHGGKLKRRSKYVVESGSAEIKTTADKWPPLNSSW